MKFNNLYWFLLILAIAPILLLVLHYGRNLYHRRLHRFIAARLTATLVTADNARLRRRRLIFFSVACLFLVTSLARPLLNEREEEVKRAGADFMIAIDTSRSMLVRDVAPDHDRLSAAKRAVRELMTHLSGDRVGFIGFAGDARMLTPMTMNYGTLDLVLEGMNAETTIWRPGSDIGKAIKVAAAKLRQKELESRVLVVLSDGENLEGDAVMAAREAKLQDKLTIFTVGIGSPSGDKIPIQNRDAGGNVIETEFLKNMDDEEIVSKLDEQVLRTIAQVSGGGYVRLDKWDREADRASALCELYDNEIKPLAKSLRVAKVVSHAEMFQIPLGIAILLLFLEMLVFERRKPAAGRARSMAAAIAMLALGSLYANARPEQSSWREEIGEWKGGKLFIPPAPEGMRIDGSFDDWKQIHSMPLPHMKKDSSKLKLAWDQRGILGAVRWSGGWVEIDKQAPWKAHCLELFIEKDNALDHEVADADHEVEQYVFFPEQFSRQVTNAAGNAYWMIPMGIHKTKGALQSDPKTQDGIICYFDKGQWHNMVEFLIPASWLKPATMEAWTKMTLHFSVSTDGWPSDLFACDHKVNKAFRRPVTWRTVSLRPPPGDKSAASGATAEDRPPSAEETAEAVIERASAAEATAHKKTVEARVALLARAERMMKKGHPEEAMAFLREQLLDWPDDAFFLYNYGVVAYAVGDLIAAEASWNKVAVLNVSSLRDRTFLQLGNVTFRQAYALKATPRNWDKALMLYRQAEDHYRQIEKPPEEWIRNAATGNLSATCTQLGAVYLARGCNHLETAAAARKRIESHPDARAWEVNELIAELIAVAGKADADFDDLGKVLPGNADAVDGKRKANELLEFGLLAKARAIRKEVDEAGSTQNEVWTVKQYQEAISLYNQVLDLNPECEPAEQERREVREATRDVYMAEAGIEREMAKRIIKKCEKVAEMETKIAELRGQPGADKMKELASLESHLRMAYHLYPPVDPEVAIEHWQNAAEDYEIANSFTPGDRLVAKQAKEVFETLYNFRKDLAERYLSESKELPFGNDEEADAVVKKQELAVGHLREAQKMKPDKAKALLARESHVKKVLATSYVQRGDLYVKLGQQKRVLHLDRGVAYLEKAGQDYTFASRMDPELEVAGTSHKAATELLMKWRVELSKQIADMYEQEAAGMAEEEDMEVTIDESKLRGLALQKQEQDDSPGRTYETVERPEPLFNW